MKYNTNTGRLFLNQKNSFIAAFALFTATCASVNAGVLSYPVASDITFNSYLISEIQPFRQGSCGGGGFSPTIIEREGESEQVQDKCNSLSRRQLRLPSVSDEAPYAFIVGRDDGLKESVNITCSENKFELVDSFIKLTKDQVLGAIDVSKNEDGSRYGLGKVTSESDTIIEKRFTLSADASVKMTAKLESFNISVIGSDSPIKLNLQWTLYQNDSSIESGTLTLETAISSVEEHAIDVSTKQLSEGDYSLRFNFFTTQLIQKDPCVTNLIWSEFDRSTFELEASCPGDLNFDGNVDSADLGTVLGDFGSTGGPSDFNEDGYVDSSDLGVLLGNFGSCEPE